MRNNQYIEKVLKSIIIYCIIFGFCFHILHCIIFYVCFTIILGSVSASYLASVSTSSFASVSASSFVLFYLKMRHNVIFCNRESKSSTIGRSTIILSFNINCCFQISGSVPDTLCPSRGSTGFYISFVRPFLPSLFFITLDRRCILKGD